MDTEKGLTVDEVKEKLMMECGLLGTISIAGGDGMVMNCRQRNMIVNKF